ncbi:hypothetical protein GTY54_11460, partial [Streptomyces sp. SID625]|nr:hypothetical protein [Streptomyces sp. SID625]
RPHLRDNLAALDLPLIGNDLGDIDSPCRTPGPRPCTAGQGMAVVRR